MISRIRSPWQWLALMSLLLGSAGCVGKPYNPEEYRNRDMSWSQGQRQGQEQEPPTPSVIGNPDETVLVQLRTAHADLATVRRERDQLNSEVALLAQTSEQVKSDNNELQELVDSLRNTQEAVELEAQRLQSEVEKLQKSIRDQLDQVLAERIQRVRVERELILAKIAEAERLDDN